MFKINDYIVYNKDICKIEKILKKYYNDEDYYELKSVSDKSLNIKIPVSSKKIRTLITKEQLKEIISSIPNIEAIEENDRMMENTYKTLMHSGTHEDLIKIIKTTYLRNEKRINDNKKISEIDDSYFRTAEKFLYNEFSIVLNKTYDETKDYVINEVLKSKKK